MSDSNQKIEAFMRRIRTAANVALTESGKVLADKMVKSLGNRGGHGERSRPGAAPNIQTGELSRSLGYSQATNYRSIVGSGIFYAKVLEFGKVIRAKKKALLIPLSRIGQAFMLHNRGGHFALLAYQYKYAKAVVRLKTASGVLIGHKVGGKNKRYEIDFLLTAKAEIKPRPFMRPSLAKAKAEMHTAFCAKFGKLMGVQ